MLSYFILSFAFAQYIVPSNYLHPSLKSESESHLVVSNSCKPMDCSPPGSSVYGILQARIPTGVGSHSLHQGIFPTQKPNLGLLHCRQIPSKSPRKPMFPFLKESSSFIFPNFFLFSVSWLCPLTLYSSLEAANCQLSMTFLVLIYQTSLEYGGTTFSFLHLYPPLAS